MKKPLGKGPVLTRGKQKSPRVVIISGLSGSGKTVALRAVEDMHFFCVDNLPVSLIDSLVSRVSHHPGGTDIAVGVDIREKESLPGIDNIVAKLRERYRLEIIFLEAEPQVLIRRFKETRRPHPLGGDLEAAIHAEKLGLEPLKQNADRVIDTSSYSPHQLRALITSLYSRGGGETRDMTVTLISFGFKYGVPQNVDLLFDVRFLPNPFFVPSLKHSTGTDRRTAEYVLNNSDARAFLKKTINLLAFLLPRYRREGRTYLSVGVGCTGGNHRSPAIVEEIARLIAKKYPGVNVVHRDMS